MTQQPPPYPPQYPQQGPAQSGYPSQQPAGYPQQATQPGYPQQPQYQQPPQGQAQQQYPQQTQYGGGIPQAQASAPMQQTQGLPTIYRADPNIIAAAHRKAVEEAERIAKARAGGGFSKRKWSPPGPRGEDKWGADVPVGYASKSLVWVCPPWGPEGRFFQEDSSHFWKSQAHPQGAGCGCPGKDTCPLCFSSKLLYKTGVKADAARAKYGRQRSQAIFQILLLEFPQSHWDQETGKMLPWTFYASGTVKKGILDVIETRNREGLGDLTDPTTGAPIWITKTKTGHDQMDVEWSVQPSQAGRSLHQSFWPALHNLRNLSELVQTATQGEMVEAIRELGYPFTPEVQQLLNAMPVAAPQAGQVPQQQQQQPQGQMNPAYPASVYGGQQAPQYPQQQPQGQPQQGYPQQNLHQQLRG